MPDIFTAASEDQVQINKRGVEQYSTVMAKEKRTRNHLSAFMVKPTLRFETQDAAEEILLLLRPHWITNVPWILIVVVALIVPFLVQWLPFFEVLPERLRLVGTIVWWLLVLGYALESFLTWFFNIFIISDERVIDIDFYSLIYKEVAVAKIDQIEDVTFYQGGVIRALLDFGTVFIQTAGEKREFDFENVPHPRKVVTFLNEMILEEEREKIENRVM